MADKFSSATRTALMLRAGTLCSNPNCLCATAGPHTDSSKAVTVGEAAHITAASKGGPRYDDSVSSEYRKSAANGLWLCSKCADLIDKDEANYSVELLTSWKATRESDALSKINGCPLPSSANGNSVGTHSIIPIPEQYRQRLKQEIEINESNELSLTLEAIEYSNHGRLDDAIDIFTSIAYTSHNFESARVSWAFFYRIAEIDFALFIANRLVAISESTAQKCVAENSKALTLAEMGRPTLAENALELAKDYAIEAKREDLVAQQLTGLGLLRMLTGKNEAAEDLLNESLAICERIHFAEGATTNYGCLGQLYAQTDRIDEAEKMHLKALIICERENDLKGQALQLCNLGLIASRNDNNSAAETFHQRALEIDTRIGWKKGIASHSMNIAKLLHNRGEETEAEPYLETARKLFAELGDYHLAYRAYHSMDNTPLF